MKRLADVVKLVYTLDSKSSSCNGSVGSNGIISHRPHFQPKNGDFDPKQPKTLTNCTIRIAFLHDAGDGELQRIAQLQRFSLQSEVAGGITDEAMWGNTHTRHTSLTDSDRGFLGIPQV